MTDEKDARLTRQLIREELDASNSYEEKAQATSDPEAAKVYRDISREEKVHAGELQALLDREDPESTEAMKEGMEETGLTGSFKDIFDRKREDYIHKSMYGVHFEKKLPANKQKILDRGMTDLDALDRASAEGIADAENAQNAVPKAEEKASSLIDIISPEARRALAGGSHQSLVDSYKGEENERPYIPRGRMRIPIDDLLKFKEDGPERANETGYGDADTGYIESDADRLYNIAMMQGAGEQEDGSIIPVSSKEFVKPKPRNKGLISDTQRNLSWGNDYDEIFDPDQIGDTEVERYVRERDFKDEGDAPTSAMRSWLTWRYFGNHLLQATPIREEVKDEFGNPLTHPVRVPATKEEPVLDENGNEVGKRKVPIPSQFETVQEPITRIIMNYRISRVGKDTQYDWEPFVMKSLWDPTAFNPVTKKNTGAFIPEQITTPDGTVIYDINDPNRTKDPWTTMEEEMTKQALYRGVVAYITDPEYRAEVDRFTPKRASKGGPKWNTPFIDEIREKIMNADPSTFGADTGAERMTQVLQMMNTMSASDFNKVIAKVALQYKDMDAEFARAKEAAVRHKSQLDSLIESAVSEKVSKHLNDWLTKNNVIGLDDGETVTADNIYRFYDSISGMYRFSIRGEKVEMPMEKLEAWMDHATRYYDQDARLRYNAALKEEAKVQEAFNERQNIEDKAISDYIYNAMRNELNEMGGKMEGFSVLALHEAADELTQELLYGDGTKFQEFMSVMGDIEAPSGDPRSILLQKAGFNWDVFENNRKLLRQSADMALTAEVSSMKDPKFHLQVAEDLKAAFIKRKNGIMGVLAVAAANKEASRRMANDPDWLWERTIQAYLNHMTKNGNERGMFDGTGNVIARARDVFNADKDTSKDLQDHLRNNWIAKGPDDVKPTEGGGWDNYFDEKMSEHVPNMLDQVISNVGNAIRGNSEFKESLFKGQFAKRYGGETMKALVDYLSDPNADTGALKARIMNGDTQTLKALMNINGKARLGNVYKERGLKGDEGGTMDLSQAREDLGRMIYASMTPGGARDRFATTMRNVARSTIQKILDDDLDDPELRGFTERLVKGAYETTLNNLVRMAALNSAQIRVEKAHAIVKPKLKRPTPGEEDYATKKAEYDAAWKEYGDSTAARTQEIYEMRDKLLLDPEFVAKHRQVFENLAKEKTADTIARDRHLRDKFSKALGQSSRIMSLTGFQNLGEGTMWEGDNERSSLDGMVELTDREKMDKLIADYKGDLGMTKDEIQDLIHDIVVYGAGTKENVDKLNAFAEKVGNSGNDEMIHNWIDMLNKSIEYMGKHPGGRMSEYAFNRIVNDSEFMNLMEFSDYNALVKMYMARGYPTDQAEERARQYIELHDVSSSVPERDSPDAIVGEYTADTQVHPDDLSEADTTKLVLGAMKNYFEKELRPTITDPKDLEALENGGREGKMVIFKYLADKGLAKPIYDNPADKENKKPTGYSVNWDAFSEPDVESKWTGPANIKGNIPIGLGNQKLVEHKENALGKRILSDYIGSSFSLGSVQKLYPKYADSTREHGIRAYETTLEKLVRNRMVDNLADQLKMEGRNPRKAKSLAKRMVSDRFDQVRISSKNLSEQGTPFAEDLEEFGITPETIQELKVEAMRTSNAPYYTKFIKPFFERSNRKVGPSTAADELKLFEQLNSGDPEAKNHPEFQEYWNQFMNTPGLMHPNLASRLTQGMSGLIRRGRKGLNIIQDNQDEAMNGFYGDGSTIQGKQLAAMALSIMADEESTATGVDSNAIFDEMRLGKTPVDSDKFREHVWNLLHMGYEPEGVTDVDAFEREFFARLVNDPEVPINFKGMEAVQNRVKNKHKREQEKQKKEEKKARELKALQAKFGEEAGEKAYNKASLDELLKNEEEIQERHRIGTESEKKIHADRLKAQGGPRSPPREEGDIKPPKQEDVTNLSSVLQDSLNIFARATPGKTPEMMTQIPKVTVADKVNSPTKDFLDAKNKVDSQSDDLGGGRTTHDDVKQTDFTVTDDAQKQYEADLADANANLQKKQASAFDTPFADILSTKRTQAIRKTETGTVISPESVSAPMTEQTSAPREQNSVETGGFAELMKSKMASTHMMEEPSEEREDWIPMRNGYRRVTIGSGKDCVRSMMRNPPRSANAPGTRTRKV